MSKTKKITKVKSKNLIIFIICIILIVISITYGLSKVNKKQTTNKPNVEDKVPNNKTPQEEKPQEEKELTEMEKVSNEVIEAINNFYQTFSGDFENLSLRDYHFLEEDAKKLVLKK